MNLDLGLPPELESGLSEVLQRVEAELHNATKFSDPLAEVSTHHLMDAGGKRLRPLVTLLAAQFGNSPTEPGRIVGAENPAVLDAAVVVELTHLATLYHDDVMDSAPLRRGAPSANEVWGNHIAILTGDLLFARSSALTANLGPEAVRIQAETFERLVLGQLHETVGPPPGTDPVAFYLDVLRDKTASLTATAARYGAMFAGAPLEVQLALARYGEAMGVAFQLADDVLDFTSANSGKAVGTDLRENVVTMPILLIQQRVANGTASPDELMLIAGLAGDLSDDAVLADLVELLRKSSALIETLELAAEWSAAAVAALAPLPDGPEKLALQNLATAVIARST